MELPLAKFEKNEKEQVCVWEQEFDLGALLLESWVARNLWFFYSSFRNWDDSKSLAGLYISGSFLHKSLWGLKATSRSSPFGWVLEYSFCPTKSIKLSKLVHKL